MLRRTASDGGADLPANVRRAARMPVSMAHSANRRLIPAARCPVSFDPGFDLFHTRGTPSHVVGRTSGSASAIALGSPTSVTCTPRTMWRSARTPGRRGARAAGMR